MELMEGNLNRDFRGGILLKKLIKKMKHKIILKNSKIPQTFPFKIPKSQEATNSSTKYYKNVMKVIKSSQKYKNRCEIIKRRKHRHNI